MDYLTLPPSAHLAKYIKCFYDHKSDQPFSYFAMADIYPKLYFRYSGLTTEVDSKGNKITTVSAALHGQRSSCQLYTFQKDFGSFGVHLLPQAIPVFFGIPAIELNEKVIDLQSLLGNESSILQNKIIEAKTFIERTKIMEDYFLQKLIVNYKKTLPVFTAIQKIIELKGLTDVKQLANQCGISERQMLRQFQLFGGFTPKLFSRITRFKETIESTNRNPYNIDTLTQIGYNCGYYDQSHFIHDFKLFSGLCPKEFFCENTPIVVLPH